jgi:hypothetical protein
MLEKPGGELTVVGDCHIHATICGELLKLSRHGDLQDSHSVQIRYAIRQHSWVAMSTKTEKAFGTVL